MIGLIFMIWGKFGLSPKSCIFTQCFLLKKPLWLCGRELIRARNVSNVGPCQ